jgi:2-methylcitrate dehydratase PrpD
MKVDPTLQSGADGSRPATVVIKLKNGMTETLSQKFPKGSPQVPMTPDELRGKFMACARGALGDASCQRVIEYVDKLESVTNVRSLTRLL